MAEERKPKIDLKARLGKASAGGTPSTGAAIPVPVPSSHDQPPPPVMPPPPMPGIAVGSPSPFAVDPSNPLAAVAAPYRPPAPPQATRIEVDESTVQQARTGARKQGLLVAGIAAVVFCGVGYIAGQASETQDGRTKSRKDAAELAGDVGSAKAKLQLMSEKIEAGRTALLGRNYPAGLSKDLAAINVDFDGSKLAGRRFSGFPTEVTFQLVEFVTAVQALNDRKLVLQGLLTKLEKPLTDQLKAPAGQTNVNYVVVIDKDPGGNSSAILAPLTAPIQFTPPNLNIPSEFNFTNPLNGTTSKLAAYKGGDVSHNPGAIYVVPRTFDKACPSETAGQTAQLGAQLANVIRDIRGEKGGQQDVVTDTKPGLLERADVLVNGLTQRISK